MWFVLLRKGKQPIATRLLTVEEEGRELRENAESGLRRPLARQNRQIRLGQRSSGRYDESRRHKHYMIGIVAAAHRAGGHTVGLMLAICAVCGSLGVVMLRNGAMFAGAARRCVRVPCSSGERSK
jgi:hypothetical protein